MGSALLLAGAFLIKHWIANYPLQTAYTAEGLSTAPGNAWVRPLMIRAAIHAISTLVLTFVYYIVSGADFSLLLMICVASIDMLAHIIIDRFKVDPELFGQFQVASAAEMAQIAQDYKSSDPAVVAAAQAKSDSNKYFWWATGITYSAYGIVYLWMVYILMK